MEGEGKVKFEVWTYPEVVPYLQKAATLLERGIIQAYHQESSASQAAKSPNELVADIEGDV